MWRGTVKKSLFLISLCTGIPACASVNSSLTITGAEQPGDSGTITIAFNGMSETVAYSKDSSPAAIASALGGIFARDFGSKICAHAVGSKILFSLKSDGVFSSVTVTGSTTSFQVDTSLWPSNLINPLVELQCNPDSVIYPNTTSCIASIGGSGSGTVEFSVDGGSPFATVAVNAGSATVAAVLPGASLGTHVITAIYSGDATHAPGGGDASVAVIPATGALSAAQIYSYAIMAYQPNGNVQAYADSINGTWTSIGYDSLNRLTGAQQAPIGSATEYYCWVYDSFGNRTLQSSAPSPYQAGSPNCQPSQGVSAVTYQASYDSANHLVQTPFSSPSYDASGDVLSDDHNLYLYDDEGRVCAVQSPGLFPGTTQLTQYVYDAEGRRVAKGAISSFSCDLNSNRFALTASYGLDPDGHHVTETDGDGQWQHTNVYVAGQLLATYDDDGAHFHVMDWLGSRRVQTDYLGRVEETYQNLPFGEFVPSNNTLNLGATEQHFTGKERDTESGLDYFGARYYGSSMGRFMSPDFSDDPDPIPNADTSNPQSLNRYSYVQNNPLTNTDPDGHTCQTNSSDGNTYDDGDGQGCSTVDQQNASDLQNGRYSATVTAQPQGGFEPGSLAYNTFGPPSAATWNNAAGTVNAAGTIAVTLMAPYAGATVNCMSGGSKAGCAANMAIALLPGIGELKGIGLLAKEETAIAGVLKQVASGTTKGKEFFNLGGSLPAQAAGYYREFTVPLAGGSGRGAARLVTGAGGEIFYTADHYATFTRIK